MSPQPLKWPWKCSSVRCDKPATHVVWIGRENLLTICAQHVQIAIVHIASRVEELDETFQPPEGWKSIRKPRSLGGFLIGAQAQEETHGET